MCRLFTGWSLKFVKFSSTEMERGDETEIVRVKVYETERPPPVTRFNSSILGLDVGNVPINCQTQPNIVTLTTATVIIIIITTMFMVLSSWHSHCESSPGSFDECRLSAGWPPTLRPNQPIWAAIPPTKRLAATIRRHHRHLLLLGGPEVLFQDLRRDEIRGWWWWWWLSW